MLAYLLADQQYDLGGRVPAGYCCGQEIGGARGDLCTERQ